MRMIGVANAAWKESTKFRRTNGYGSHCIHQPKTLIIIHITRRMLCTINPRRVGDHEPSPDSGQPRHFGSVTVLQQSSYAGGRKWAGIAAACSTTSLVNRAIMNVVT